MARIPELSNGNRHVGNVPFTGHAAGEIGAPSRQVDTQIAAGTAVSNTTTETATYTHTFPAASLKSGTVIEFDALLHVTAQNSTDTIVAGVRFGASATPGSNTSLAATTAVDAAVDDYTFFHGKIVFRADPATSVTAFWEIAGNDCDATGQAARHFFGTATFDTTGALILAITATWSVASASNSARGEIFNVRVVDQEGINPSEG